MSFIDSSLKPCQKFVVRVVDITFTMLEYVYKPFPFVIAALIFLSPCQLPFLGSLLLTTCSGWTFSMLLARCALAILEFLFISQILVSEIFYLVFILLSAIIILWNECKKCPDTLSARKYRNLMILEKLINSCVRARIFTIITMLCPILQIFGSYIIIKFHSSLEWSQLITVIMIDYYCILYNVMALGGAGSIHSKSCEWLIMTKNDCLEHKSNKFRRREIKSMTPLRIWFGSNFVDHLTPLVIQHFCIGQTINLLLMG